MPANAVMPKRARTIETANRTVSERIRRGVRVVGDALKNHRILATDVGKTSIGDGNKTLCMVAPRGGIHATGEIAGVVETGTPRIEVGTGKIPMIGDRHRVGSR